MSKLKGIRLKSIPDIPQSHRVHAIQLLTLTLFDLRYLRQATHNQWQEYANVWFEYRMGMGEQEGELLAAPKNETGQATVHRAKFLDEFVRLVPKDICHFGKRLTHLEELETKKIKLYFKDDTTTEADCVIGADGIHSVIREYLLGAGNPAIEPVFTGSVAYRGEMTRRACYLGYPG